MKTLNDVLVEAQANAASESAAFQALVADLEALAASTSSTLTVESAVVTLSDGSETKLVLPAASTAE